MQTHLAHRQPCALPYSPTHAHTYHKPLAPAPLTSPCSVHVPEVLPGMSSARVLTMEFIEGVGVTDVQAIR